MHESTGRCSRAGLVVGLPRGLQSATVRLQVFCRVVGRGKCRSKRRTCDPPSLFRPAQYVCVRRRNDVLWRTCIAGARSQSVDTARQQPLSVEFKRLDVHLTVPEECGSIHGRSPDASILIELSERWSVEMPAGRNAITGGSPSRRYGSVACGRHPSRQTAFHRCCPRNQPLPSTQSTLLLERLQRRSLRSQKEFERC
jgi:hypothetical protein